MVFWSEAAVSVLFQVQWFLWCFPTIKAENTWTTLFWPICLWHRIMLPQGDNALVQGRRQCCPLALLPAVSNRKKLCLKSAPISEVTFRYRMCRCREISSKTSSGVEAVWFLSCRVKPEKINLPGTQADSMHICGRRVCAVLDFRCQYRHNEVALYGDCSGSEQPVFISATWLDRALEPCTSVQVPGFLALLFLGFFSYMEWVMLKVHLNSYAKQGWIP